MKFGKDGGCSVDENMHWKNLYRSFTRFFAICAPALLPAQETASRYALVIGNADYKNIDKLTNTLKDAKDIAAALEKLNFAVDLRLDVDEKQFEAAVDSHIRKLEANPANEGFFWYAGHAVQIRGVNYLLPVDASVESELILRRGAYALDDLQDELQRVGNKVNVVILDACRNNPLPSTSRGVGETRGLAAIQVAPGDLFVMFSTAPGNVADDGKGKQNSPFAEAFLKFIDSGDPLVLMAADVTKETMRLTGDQQQPYWQGSIINDKNYSLNPGGVTAAAIPVLPAIAPYPGGRASYDDRDRTERFALDLGFEGNNNTLSGMAGSLNAGGDYRVLKNLSLGGRMGYSNNFADVAMSAAEIGVFARWHFFNFEKISLFAQGTLGISIVSEAEISKPLFLGEIGAGMQFRVLKSWRLGPYFRLGYPFLYGFGLTAGYVL
jgi:hypothetical protein